MTLGNFSENSVASKLGPVPNRAKHPPGRCRRWGFDPFWFQTVAGAVPNADFEPVPRLRDESDGR